MKTSEVINKLVDSLKSYGDLPTNIHYMSWYCPSENGSFEGVNLHQFNNSDEIIEDEFIDIEEFKEHQIFNTRDILELEMFINKINADYNYKINGLIKNQKKMIERLNNRK